MEQQATSNPRGREGTRAGRVAVGHPVDVASGEQFTAAHDVEAPGVSPLIFRRLYNTTFLDRPASVLGPGWVHAFEATLTKDLDGFVFEGHDGDRVEFDDVHLDFETGCSLLNSGASMELRREGERLVVYHWHDVDEPVQKYVFDARRGDRMLLVARELPSGQGVSIERDRRGRVMTLTQKTESRRLYFGYDAGGRLESLHLGLAAGGIEGARCVARYHYDSRGRLVAVQDANGAERRYDYDDAGRLTLEQDRRGGTYRMSYDAKGRCIESSGDDGYQRRRFIYEPGQTTRVVDSLGHETLYQYNDLGQVERQIDPNGATHVTEFDDTGRVAKEINPVGATTTYEYDARGHLAKKTFPNGASLSYEYDELHQPTKITEPDGAVWVLAYERGALVDVTDPFGRNVRYVRDTHNQLIGALTSSGQELRVRTNDEWTEETIEDQYGVLVRRQLDVYLNPTASEDGQGPLGKAEYDRLGRLIRSERPDGSKRHFTYDNEGAITRLIDARGGIWRATYSAYGDCVEQIDPLGRTHRFAWNTESRLVSIVNPKSEQAHFKYDLVGNLTSIQHFDGSIERASYDLAARLVRRQRPDGTQLTLERDVVGNLLKLKAGTQELRSFQYDSCGSPLEANSRDAQVLFEYAVGGRLKAEMQQGRRIEYEYDSRGFLAKRTFEGSKAGPLHFEHDERGRLRRFYAETDSATPPRTRPWDSPTTPSGQSFDYDSRDQCTRRQLGPHTEERHHDLQGRLRHQNIAGITSRTYQYDAESALIELVDKLRGRKEYKYDLAEQLLSSINTSLGDHLYQYDLNGNLVAKDMVGLSYDSGNRLSHVGDVTFECDTNGQLVRQISPDRDDRYEWDALGQLLRVQHRDGAETWFGYDAFGRRVFKEHRAVASTEPDNPLDGFEWAKTRLPGEPTPIDGSAIRRPKLESGRTEYFWAGDDLLAEARNDNLTEYAMWGFVAEALWEDGELRHIVNSQQGVPQELVDDRGKLVWQGTFDDWGKLVAEKGETTCRLRLPGQLADDETGLHCNRFRYYSPDAGQFVSPDLIGFLGGTNEYRFAANALNWADPLGLNCHKDGCVIAEGTVYRGGSATDGNFTPRPGTDTHGPKRGLSTFDTPTAAAKPGEKYQIIDVSKLGPDLEAIRQPDGHVSIRPKNESQLGPWAAERGNPHPLTDQVRQAHIGGGKRST